MFKKTFLTSSFLLLHLGESQKTQGAPFCPCGAEDSDDMIMCDDNNCKHQWFHYLCVGITEDTVPVGKWFCPSCSGRNISNIIK